MQPEPETREETRSLNSKMVLTRRRWEEITSSMNLIGLSQIGLFILAVAFTLHRIKPVLLPIILALLVTMVLRPIYRALRKIKIPRLLASFLTVSLLIALLIFSAYQIAIPGAQWAKDVDFDTMTTRVKKIFKPMTEVRANIRDVADKVEAATDEEVVEGVEAIDPEKEVVEGVEAIDPENPEGADQPGVEVEPTTEDREPQEGVVSGDEPEKAPVPEEIIPTEKAPEKVEAAESPAPPNAKAVLVEIKQDPLEVIMDEAQELGLSLGAFIILVLFMLAYGNNIVKSLNENSAVEEILTKMGHDVSLYLFTITIINATLGLCIGIAMWLLGLPNPALWGLMAMFLNFIPYVGALIGTVLVFFVAAASFDAASTVLQIPIVYFVLTLIEGNFVTPILLGKRFSLNPLAVLIWVFCWAGFWGIAGMLIALPALVIFKIVCENTATMDTFQRVISSGDGTVAREG